MCLKRNNNDISNKFLDPSPMVNNTIQELGPNEPNIENEQRVRYNLLLNNDEEESETGYISNMEDSDEDDNDTHLSTIHDFHDLTNGMNQNSNSLSLSNILDTDQSIENRAFELSIPDILSSMARVSQHLETIVSAHLANSASRN